jgi:hypothetical protein
MIIKNAPKHKTRKRNSSTKKKETNVFHPVSTLSFFVAFVLFASPLFLHANSQYFDVDYITDPLTPQLNLDGVAAATYSQLSGGEYEIDITNAPGSSDEVSLTFSPTDWPISSTYFAQENTDLYMDWEFIADPGAGCRIGFFNDNQPIYSNGGAFTNMGSVARNVQTLPSSSGASIYGVGIGAEAWNGDCTGSIILYSLTDSNGNTLFSKNELDEPETTGLPSFLASVILEFPESVNFQTDAINFSLGMMIFLMSINTWFVIIKRKD